MGPLSGMGQSLRRGLNRATLGVFVIHEDRCPCVELLPNLKGFGRQRDVLDAVVPHPLLILGYSRFNFVRASSISNCQSTPRCLALVLSAQLPISDWSKGSSPMRRSVRH